MVNADAVEERHDERRMTREIPGDSGDMGLSANLAGFARAFAE